MLGSIITSFPGSSVYFLGGVVSYSNSAKENILGVSKEVMMEKGAVSREVAVEMAEGVRRLFGSDVSLSITGIAGPGGGTAEKPVGLVWMGISWKGGTAAMRFDFTGDRDAVRKNSTDAAVRVIADLVETLI
jgi:PncC family amidohydrolase